VSSETKEWREQNCILSSERSCLPCSTLAAEVRTTLHRLVHAVALSGRAAPCGTGPAGQAAGWAVLAGKERILRRVANRAPGPQ